jgi:RsiW-degrading membrane proteinase PrsW (M82 family)
VAVFVVLLMVLSGLLVLAVVTSSTGVVGFLIGLCLALLPLPVVLAAFRWLDRYEPEPRSLLAFTFFWGATVAALVSATINTVSAVVVAGTGGGEDGSVVTAVVVAPWVEEAAKGAAVLAVLLFRRREFDGIVDGIVFAGTVGVGFAFTENILYFGRAFLAGSAELGLSGGVSAVGLTFLLRGVLAPFAHPLFTVMTGIGLGLAATARSAPVRWVAPVVGYLAAVALHAAWNFSAVGGLAGFLSGYVMVMVPAFVVVISVAVWLRRREGRVVARTLPAYVEAGWLAPEDVAMLSSLPARRQAVRWARGTLGEGFARAMRDFQVAATELAFLRERAERGRDTSDFPARERELLAQVARARAAVTAPSHR